MVIHAGEETVPIPLLWFHKDDSQVFMPSRKQKYPLLYYHQGNKLLSKTINQNYGGFSLRVKTVY